MRPARNGVDYSLLDPPGPDALRTCAAFHPNCGLIDSNMGKLPAEVIRRESVRRGNHPLNSFSAVGPQAEHLASGQNYADVYAPIRALINYNGLVVLIGVGLNCMTALYLAEQQAGRNLFVRWALNTNGRPCMIKTGGCSEGFPRLQPVLQNCAGRFTCTQRDCRYTEHVKG